MVRSAVVPFRANSLSHWLSTVKVSVCPLLRLAKLPLKACGATKIRTDAGSLTVEHPQVER
jgi:hypothetical protein